MWAPFRRGNGVRLRLWMIVNVTALALISYAVSVAVTHSAVAGPAGSSSDAAHSTHGVPAAHRAPISVIPTKQQLLNPGGLYYGVATPSAPWSGAEVKKVTAESGAAPDMTEYFVKWTQDFDPAAVASAYRHGTVPVLSWEPWKGLPARNGRKGTPSFDTDQPAYRLARIAGGSYDAYITRFARAVAASRMPLVLRFAHEMNGNWYPWSEQTNGNHRGDYVKAWRHVHDLFTQAGADNVIWLWSPNIVRALPDVRLAPLYPGNAYVDWVGLVGYGAETKAKATFGTTLTQLRKVAPHKPILITETGALPSVKSRWITDFLSWLPKNKDIIGFIWFEKDPSSGGTGNWRFDADPASLRAFRAGIKADLPRLARPTTAWPPAGANQDPVPGSTPTPASTSTQKAP
ncbi:Beta-mannanase [Streptacidiphilus jiangxiensis]|uniref:Beta-mannanase n=1 Tax=Streptacidiphilus jiangxiensis TaxID=235985 RepID=A0A1H7PXV4_STRJI|nr:Beta-mannanase [Streptacidiphilus jiangxiensis]